MSKITVDYTSAIQWDIAEGTSIEQLLNDRNLQASAGFDPSRVNALINGCVVSRNTILTAGVTVELEDRAASKAV